MTLFAAMCPSIATEEADEAEAAAVAVHPPSAIALPAAGLQPPTAAACPNVVAPLPRAVVVAVVLFG